MIIKRPCKNCGEMLRYDIPQEHGVDHCLKRVSDRLAESETKFTKVIGIVQRAFQPGGSPPALDSVGLVYWLVGVIKNRLSESKAEIARLTGERDEAQAKLSTAEVALGAIANFRMQDCPASDAVRQMKDIAFNAFSTRQSKPTPSCPEFDGRGKDPCYCCRQNGCYDGCGCDTRPPACDECGDRPGERRTVKNCPKCNGDQR